MPSVATIVPVYNRAERIIETLTSIHNQTIDTAFLTIIVDDASQDQTCLRVKQWIDTHHTDPHRQYKLIESVENCGPSSARNRGIQAAVQQGFKWLAFCDSDDLWHDQKLEQQLAVLNQTGKKVCHTNELWVKSGKHHNPKKHHAKPEGRIFKNCLPLCCVSPSTVMIHQSVFEAVGGFDESLRVCEDYDLWLRVFARYEAVLCQDRWVTKVGGHADQLSRQVIGMDRYRLYALIKAHRDLRVYLTQEEKDDLDFMITQKAHILEVGYRKHNKRYDVFAQVKTWAEQGTLSLHYDVLNTLLT